MIVNQSRNLTFTIPAGQTLPVEVSGSYIKLLSCSLSEDLIVSFDYGLSCQIAEGVGIPTVQLSKDRKTLVPAVFDSVQLTNPSQIEPATVKVSISLGAPSDSRSFIQGEVNTNPAGTPGASGLTDASAAAGIVVALSKKVREVAVYCDPTAAVNIYDDAGVFIGKLGADSWGFFNWNNTSITLKGNGATAKISVTVSLAE